MALPFKGLMYELVAKVHNQGPADVARRTPCADMELNSIECLEAYGIHKGYPVCRKLLEDLEECRSSTLRSFRFEAMKRQRLLQLVRGERKLENLWGPKYAYDGYIEGTFMP